MDLQVVYARQLYPDRVNLGWRSALPRCAVEWLPRHISLISAVRRVLTQRDRFHIVNGIWAENSFTAALITLALTRREFAIYSEAPDPFQYRPRWKRFLQACLGKAIAPRAKAVFPVSHFAEEFFLSLGVEKAAIFPFAYFRATPDPRPLPRTSGREAIFVGQLITRKGLDWLIESIAPLLTERTDIHLTLLGAGDMRETLERRVLELDLAGRIRFELPVESTSIPQRLAAADILVLPSRWDGWGLVVNEALSVGIPAIVSDRCGAADVIRHGINGYVVPFGDVAALRQCLRASLTTSEILERLKRNALATGLKLGSNFAASYLVDCLNYLRHANNPRPLAPWLTADEVAA